MSNNAQTEASITLIDVMRVAMGMMVLLAGCKRETRGWEMYGRFASVKPIHGLQRFSRFTIAALSCVNVNARGLCIVIFRLIALISFRRRNKRAKRGKLRDRARNELDLELRVLKSRREERVEASEYANGERSGGLC